MKLAILLFIMGAANTEAAYFRGYAAHTKPIVSNATIGTASTGQFLFPATLTSDFLTGFDVAKGQTSAGVFEPIVDCSSATTDACIQEIPATDGTVHYDRMVSTEAANSALTKTVVSAEGGGWGVTVSASTSYLQQSSINTRSVSYILGQSSKTKVRSVKNPGNLKLTDQAKRLLQKDPEQFLQNYGPHYTKAIAYGGSFLGSYTLNSKDTLSHSELDVAASVKYSGGIFSAKGSAEFQQQRSSSLKNLQIDANFKSSPGVKSSPLEEPADMKTTFENWEDVLAKKPVPLTVSLGPWSDSADVAAILNKLPKDVQHKFYGATLSPEFGLMIAGDVNKAKALKKTIDEAEDWREVAKTPPPPQLQQLQALYTKVDRHVQEADTRLTEARLLQLQDDYIDQSDTSWFTADSFEDEFKAIIAQIPHPTPAPLVCESNEWKSGYYGEFVTCDRGGYLDGLCASGRNGDCGDYKWTAEHCCSKPNTAHSDSNSTLGNDGWSCGRWGDKLACPAGQVMTGYCGSGVNADCQDYCPEASWFGIRCDSLGDGITVDSSPKTRPADGWNYESYGTRFVCEAGSVACGACGSGENADCQGKHFGVKCCPATM